jgi:hypothetical protein
MTFKVILHLNKTLCLDNVDILEKILKDCVLNKEYIEEKYDF